MSLRSPSVLFAVSVGFVLAATSAGAQKPTRAVGASTSLRAPDGRPDLQGVWDFRTVTPLERPAEFAGQSVLTAEQAAKLEAQARGHYEILAKKAIKRLMVMGLT